MFRSAAAVHMVDEKASVALHLVRNARLSSTARFVPFPRSCLAPKFEVFHVRLNARGIYRLIHNDKCSNVHARTRIEMGQKFLPVYVCFQ